MEAGEFSAAVGSSGESLANVLKLLAGAGSLTVDEAFSPPGGTPSVLTDLGEACMPLDGLIDIEAERARVGKELARVEQEVEKAGRKLENPKFVENAKPEVVAEARERLADWQEKRARLESMLGNLG